ncbi:hypothetical protein ACFE04_001188 [Oxalis oulophora]
MDRVHKRRRPRKAAPEVSDHHETDVVTADDVTINGNNDKRDDQSAKLKDDSATTIEETLGGEASSENAAAAAAVVVGYSTRSRKGSVPRKNYAQLEAAAAAADDYGFIAARKKRKKIANVATSESLDEDEKGDDGLLSDLKTNLLTNKQRINSLMCHQCQRNDKGRVVRCINCGTKRFCIPCLTTWYPHMTEDEIAECCPVCLENCNCKRCLRLDVPLKSCIKVALDFVSPENVGECIRLSEEFRLLPPNHRAKEDKLEVKKMTIYAISGALKDLGHDMGHKTKTGEIKTDDMPAKKRSNKSRKK